MIQQVQLANYRSHKLTNIVLAPFTVLLGAMGVGKTSILHAISLILSGQNPLVNAKSEGLRREIRQGESEFHIGLRLDDGTVIDKKVTDAKHSVGFNGSYADVKVQKGKILAKLGVELEDIVLCLLDPTRFFTRDEKTQRNVLLRFMSSKKVDAPEIVKQLKLADYFDSAGQIEELIREIKDERLRTLNREIKNANAALPAAVSFDAGKKKALVARLGELNQKRDGILRQQARDEEWKKTAERLEKQLAGVTQPDPAVSIATLEAEEKRERDKVPPLREKWEAIVKRRNELLKQRDSVANEVERLTKVVQTLDGLGKQCPTCQRDLKPADKKALIDHIQGEIKAAQDLIGGAENDLAKVRKEVEGVEQQGNEQKKVVEAIATRRLEVSQQIASYAQAKKAVEDHQASKPKDTNWPKELAEVANDIAAASLDLQEVEKAEQQSSSREIQVTLVRSKEGEAEKLDTAAKELATLKDTILAESSGGFIDSMQEFVDHFGLGEVQFSLDPFGFSVGGVYTDQLSGGQKVILEAALRQAAAKASGLKVMALDDANMLTPAVRQKLSGVLMQDAVQVIICSMTDEEPKIATHLPANVKMYWLSSPSLVGPTSVKELRGGA